MAGPSIPLLRPPTPADLQRARDEIPWVDDGDLREVERRSAPGAFFLSLLTWGGGHLYVRSFLKGSLLILALFAWLVAAAGLPGAGWIGPLVWLGVGTGAGLLSFDGARRVNRFVVVRDDVQRLQGPPPDAFRLIAAAATVDATARQELARIQSTLAANAAARAPAPPSPGGRRHAELVDKLRKLAALRAAGVINPTELAERKIDVLSAIAPATRAELDDLLYELLPLGGEGVLGPEDFDFLKRLGSPQP